MLSFYSQQFSTVEINHTFYRPPKSGTDPGARSMTVVP
ncbi:MAG: DUF72 domain-containing protein [Terriglobia bacterium]